MGTKRRNKRPKDRVHYKRQHKKCYCGWKEKQLDKGINIGECWNCD